MNERKTELLEPGVENDLNRPSARVQPVAHRLPTMPQYLGSSKTCRDDLTELATLLQRLIKGVSANDKSGSRYQPEEQQI